MKCACKKCNDNVNGYCHCDSYIQIDEEGMCDMFTPQPEPEDSDYE